MRPILPGALATCLAVGLLAHGAIVQTQVTDSILIRGRPQKLRLYGQRGNPPVIVSSGDGGWLHLAPDVAETLAKRGFFVVGLDVKAYLESFTSRSSVLRPDNEPKDFAVLAAYASRGSVLKPTLIGVSEGAGLSVLAATDPATRAAIAGVVGIGLPNLTELAWRWKDALIYLTHGVPNEPTFSTAAIVSRVAPAPLAIIHSTHDEFVSLSEVERIFAGAREPKRLWIIRASDHRFSDNLADFDNRLADALAWIHNNAKE